MTLRILIVEDEAAIARRIARMAVEILGDALPSIATTIEDARRLLASAPPDILFLDLNLDGDQGFDLLRNSPRCPSIVVSACTDQALDGFKHGLSDFVPKPFSKARLELAIHRALESSRPPEFLGVRQGSGTAFVPFDEIVFVRGAGAHSELTLAGGNTVEYDHMLDRIERLLPANFQRIHKSLIVDVHRVERLVAAEGSRYEVLLRDGTKLPVGRTRVGALRARLA